MVSSRPCHGYQVVAEASLVQGQCQLHHMVFLWRAVNSGQQKLKGTVPTIQDWVPLHKKTISRLILGRGRCAAVLGVCVSNVERHQVGVLCICIGMLLRVQSFGYNVEVCLVTLQS